MASKANPRNHRNNPYALDMFAAQVHHSAAGALFRFRTELFVLLMGLGAFLALARIACPLWALVILAGLVLALFALPWTRRFVIRRAWCVISRHRLQRVFYETRMHTRSGRLSLILWIRPTQVGERAWSGAALASAPRTSKPTPAKSPPPATPAKPASPNRHAGRSSSPSISCAATPSPRTPSSHPAWHPPCRRPPLRDAPDDQDEILLTRSAPPGNASTAKSTGCTPWSFTAGFVSVSTRRCSWPTWPPLLASPSPPSEPSAWTTTAETSSPGSAALCGPDDPA